MVTDINKDFVDSNWNVELIEFPRDKVLRAAKYVRKADEFSFGDSRNRLEQKVYVGIANAQHVRLYERFANAERWRQTEMRMFFGAVVFALTALVCFFGVS